MEYARSVIDAGLRMLRQGETIGTWGNVSILDPERGEVYITPSGMAYDSLTEEDVTVLSLNGERLRGERKPSVETGMHLAIYRARPEIRAIVHTHPVYSTAFAATGEEIPVFLDEAAQTLRRTVQVAEYALPGTEQLAQNCVKALGEEAMACLLRAHGAVCVGETMEKAFQVSQVLESTARILILIRSMGGSVEAYSPDRLKEMESFMKTYGQNE